MNWEDIVKRKVSRGSLLSKVERIISDLKTFDLSEQERKEADEIISQMGNMAMKNDAEGFNKHMQEFNRFYARTILDSNKFRKR